MISTNQLVEKGDLVFDIGANEGAKTDEFLRQGAFVVCVEPQPACARVLRTKYQHNPNVKVIEKGLAERKGRMKLSICSEANTLSTFSENWKKGRFSNYQWDKAIEVEVTTLDHLIDTFGMPKYCKIDVEGFEFQVLKGLSKQIPLLSFEFTKEFITSAEKIMHYLRQTGYEHFNLVLGEKQEFIVSKWTSWKKILEIIEQSEEELLWGDIYAKVETPCAVGKKIHTNADSLSQQPLEKKEAIVSEGPATKDGGFYDWICKSGRWQAGTPLRLHLGCGEQRLAGYVNIDFPPEEHSVQQHPAADLFLDFTHLELPSQSVDEIRLHHVFEHFERAQALALLIKWHRWMKIGAKLHIETPDVLGCAEVLLSDKPHRDKQAHLRHAFGSQEASWASHLDGWYEEKFEHVLTKLGFQTLCRRKRRSDWPQLTDVEVVAVKQGHRTEADLLDAAAELLKDSMVCDAPSELRMHQVWLDQLEQHLTGFVDKASTTGSAGTGDEAVGIFFSKDRALQLDAALSSFQLHCTDKHKIPVKVIYKASSPTHRKQYSELQQAYPWVEFIAENNFKQDLLAAIGKHSFVMFAVDDNLFVRQFRSGKVIGALRDRSNAVGFSLRLGKNTRYCYMRDRTQQLPEFETFGEDFAAFNWTQAECDFGYPLELSSSVYRAGQLLPLLEALAYNNPNSLEALLAENRSQFGDKAAELLCGRTSFAFCNPINKVQSVCAANRSGNSAHHTPENLALRFDEGYRFDIAELSGFVPNGCHQEVELKMKKSDGTQPTVSVVIPCFNYGQYLREAVESVVDQTFQDFEIIIVNDGSTDDTREVAEALIKEFPDHRIHLLNQENSGHPAIARNNGIAVARGEYILPLDADDKLHPGALENYLQAVEKHGSQPVVAFGWLQSFGADNSLWRAGDFHPHQLLRRNQVPSSSLFHRSVWSTQEGYRDHGFEDWAFWVGAVRIGARFCSVGQVTTYYRRTKAGSRHDTKVKDHEWFIANIICNNREVYEDCEVEWATDYLNRHISPPAEREIHGPDDRFPAVGALLVASHPERYEDKEIQWAESYLKQHPFKFTKTFSAGPLDKTAPGALPITAIIAAYNEGDVIYHVIRDYVEQGIRVYFIDHHSTDNTVAEASKWLGKGLIKIEQFPEDAGIRIDKDVYAWRYILQRKEQIAAELGPGWYIHADADEFRESPWFDLNLREGIERVDREGFNAINFKIYDFKPTDNDFIPGEDVRDYLTYYDPDIHKFNRVQVKCWKNTGQQFTMWPSGGHSVEFAERKIYPVPFVLRHYSIRSQQHGSRKVFDDRKTRFDKDERDAQWHDQYDDITESDFDFLKNRSELIRYDRQKVCREILDQQPAAASCQQGYYGYLRPEIQAMVAADAKRILDVGCASGQMAAALKQKNDAEVWGVEVVDEVAQVAAKHLDKVICADIEQALHEIPDAYFDTIIFADVLEHLQDPYSTLERVKAKLNAGGQVIASIPNVRHWSVLKDLLEGKWDYTDAGILDKSHLRFFTRKSVMQLFQNAGYEIVDARATTIEHQTVPAETIEALARGGLDVSSLAEDSRHYQYIVKAASRQAVSELQKTAPLVSIIILTCNQLEYTRKCLQSICDHTDPSVEIIFVDNGSSDGTAEYLQKQIEQKTRGGAIRLIQNTENRGFAAGNNQGMAVARGDYILLMNNDIVVTAGWLDRLIACARRNPRVGMVGPRSNYVSGPQLVEAVDYDIQTLEGLDRYAATLSEQCAGKDRRLIRVVGFCMLIKRAVIEAIGGMDDRYGLGNFEDDDFSLRAALAGFESRMAEDSFVHHFGSRTFIGEKIDYRQSLLRNWELFKEKWGLPKELPYEQGYRLDQMSVNSFEPHIHRVPLHIEADKPAVSQPSASGATAQAYGQIQALLKQGDTQSALERLKTLVKTDPDCSPAHNDLGVLYYQAGEMEKSLEHYRQAVRIEPNSTVYLKNLADLLCVEFGQIEQALQIYVEVLKFDPHDKETLVNTGHICQALERSSDAEYFYRRVLEIDPRHPEAIDGLQALSANNFSRPEGESRPGSDDKAAGSVAVPERASAQRPTAGPKKQPLVSMIVFLDATQARLKQCLLELEKSTPQLHEVLLVDSGDRKSVSRWARQHVKNRPGWKIVARQSSQVAAGGLSQAIQAASGDVIGCLSGDALVFDGWLADMLACMARMEQPGVIGPMTNAAAGIQQLDSAQCPTARQAAAYARDFRERNRHRRISCDRLEGFCMLFSRHLVQTIGLPDESLAADGTDGYDFCLRAALAGYINAIAGDVYVHRNRKRSSGPNMKRFNRKWPLTDTSSDAGKRHLTHLAMERGEQAFAKGDDRLAVDLFLEGIKLSPDNPAVYHRFARCLINTKRFKEALEVLAENPAGGDDVQQIVLEATAHEGLENVDEAGRMVERVLTLDSNSAAAMNVKGMLAHRQGAGDEAETLYRQAMALAPDFADPYTNLGALKWETDPDQALALIEKAFILSPFSNDIAGNYHTAIAATGDYPRAEAVFTEALHAYPHHRNIAYKTIDVLLQQENFAPAMEAIEAAIADFGVDDGMLEAALAVRDRLGVAEIAAAGKKKNTISLCMIVKNEEADIGRCLHSVKPAVDEMIVVDTGSDDRTRDIARVFGAKVLKLQWTEDFSAARNYAIENAAGAWTFHLDADEVISQQDHAALRKLVSRSNGAPRAFIFNTRNYTLDVNQVGWEANDGRYVDEEAGAGWTPSEKVRLLPRDPRFRFEFPVHELVEPSLMRCGVAMKRCPIPVHHYGNLKQQKSLEKKEAYYAIGRKKLAEMGDDTVALRELAIQAEILGKHDEAIELWERFVALAPDTPQAYVNMGIVHCRTGNFDALMQTAEKALALNPQLKEAQYNFALAHLHLNRAGEAVSALEKLLAQVGEYPPAEFLLAAAYCVAGRKTEGQKALTQLQQSVIGPGLAARCRELAQGFAAAGKNDFALALLEAATDCGILSKEILDLYAACAESSEHNPLAGGKHLQKIASRAAESAKKNLNKTEAMF